MGSRDCELEMAQGDGIILSITCVHLLFMHASCDNSVVLSGCLQLLLVLCKIPIRDSKQ